MATSLSGKVAVVTGASSGIGWALAKVLAGGMPGGAVCGKKEIVSMIEFRDGEWNARNRIEHPGTFNANPVSAAAGSAMLEMVKTGEHHSHADGLNADLIKGMNRVIREAGVPDPTRYQERFEAVA